MKNLGLALGRCHKCRVIICHVDIRHKRCPSCGCKISVGKLKKLNNRCNFNFSVALEDAAMSLKEEYMLSNYLSGLRQQIPEDILREIERQYRYDQ